MSDSPSILPFIHEYLFHQQERIGEAIKSGQYDERWQQLQEAVMRAGQSLVSGRPGDIASAFLSLGIAKKETEIPKDIPDLLNAKIADMQRQMPLHIQNINVKHLRQWAQFKATQYWDQDAEQSIRVAGMAAKVYEELKLYAHKIDALNALPGDHEGIRPWLREIAPPYAKAPGRPKRTSTSVRKS